MIIVRNGNRMVLDIMQQSVCPDRDYRLNPYVFSAAEENGGLLKNMETGEQQLLTPEELIVAIK